MITLGSDPELFFTKDKKFVSAVGKCKGTKDMPFEFAPGFKVHNDNVAVEFNVPPCKNVDEWVANHHKALKYVRDLAKENGCNLKLVADAEFPTSELQSEDAQAFGCNPDFNAWALEMNPSPEAKATNLRTAGGHVHIGVPELTFREKIQIVRLLDIFLGIPMAMKEPKSRRAELYGAPGAMRDKEYGVEYRTLSNYWLRSTSLMIDVYKCVYDIVSRRDELSSVLNLVEGDIKRLSDKSVFREVLQRSVESQNQLYIRELHDDVLQGA